jgi:hypothetical protein
MADEATIATTSNGKDYSVHAKVGAGAAGGAFSVLVVWGISQGLKVTVPAEVAVAIGTVISFLFGYFFPGSSQ